MASRECEFDGVTLTIWWKRTFARNHDYVDIDYTSSITAVKKEKEL